MTMLHKSFVAAALFAAGAMALSGPGLAQTETASEATSVYKPSVGQSGKDVVWVPTSQALVDRMLDLAELTPRDHLVDLGSGDGRLVITAAKRGATARGIEFNPDMVALSRRTAQAEGVGNRARFDQGDIFKSDFSNATVVTLFLLPDLNLRLRPTLLNMKPGTRVVSNTFTMDDWEPDETAQVTQGCAGHCTAYKWVIPAKVQGSWRMGEKQLVLTQKYQMIEGTLREEGATTPISEGRIDGTKISFVAGQQRYTGEISGKTMQGTVEGGGRWSATMTR